MDIAKKAALICLHFAVVGIWWSIALHSSRLRWRYNVGGFSIIHNEPFRHPLQRLLSSPPFVSQSVSRPHKVIWVLQSAALVLYIVWSPHNNIITVQR